MNFPDMMGYMTASLTRTFTFTLSVVLLVAAMPFGTLPTLWTQPIHTIHQAYFVTLGTCAAMASSAVMVYVGLKLAMAMSLFTGMSNTGEVLNLVQQKLAMKERSTIWSMITDALAAFAGDEAVCTEDNPLVDGISRVPFKDGDLCFMLHPVETVYSYKTLKDLFGPDGSGLKHPETGVDISSVTCMRVVFESEGSDSDSE